MAWIGHRDGVNVQPFAPKEARAIPLAELVSAALDDLDDDAQTRAELDECIAGLLGRRFESYLPAHLVKSEP
jgi:hypothetical protein